LPKNDEGEFELVLGNRQLISVFLIVVILLGVFFSMGYIVGRNSTPSAPAETARNDRTAPARPAVETPADNALSNPDVNPPTPAPASAPATAAPDATAPVTTQPEQAAPPPAKPAPTVKQAREPKPKPAPAPPPSSPTPAPASERAGLTGQPSSGDYWQVVATARPDAEIIAEALTKRGFHAILSPAPKDGVFRVLVGPLPDSATQASTRTNLEAAGFKNPILRKY